MKGFEYIRKLYGLSLDDVAQFCGVTNQSVSAWEQKGNVPARRLEKLEEYFGIPAQYYNMDVTAAVEDQINAIKFSIDAQRMGYDLPDTDFSDVEYNSLIQSINRHRPDKARLDLIRRFVALLDHNSVAFLQHVLTAAEWTEQGIPEGGEDDFSISLFKIMRIWKDTRERERAAYQAVLSSVPEADELY